MSSSNGRDAGGWYFRVPNAIVDDHGANLKPYALAVYITLARHTNSAGQCWPSITRLGKLTGMGRGKVIESIALLVKAGLIEKTQNPDTQGPNFYKLLLVPMENRVVPDGNGGGFHYGPGVVPRENSNKTNKNKTHSTSAPEPSKVKPSEGKSTDAFEDFWEFYPRKDAKKDAAKAWKKLSPSPDLVATIIADVSERLRSGLWRKSDPKFILLLATYLNGERWNDEGIQNGHNDSSRTLTTDADLSKLTE